MSHIKRHMNDVADLGCILCRHLGYGQSPAILHHPRGAAGGAQKASDWLVIPLCPTHHVDPKQGYHGLGDGGDAYSSGYNKGLRDAIDSVNSNETARSLSINGEPLGLTLTANIARLMFKEKANGAKIRKAWE